MSFVHGTRNDAPLTNFKAWMQNQGFSANTANTVAARVRWAFNRLGWDPGMAQDAGAVCLNRYLTLFTPEDRTLFRHAWGIYRTYILSRDHECPTLAGGHASSNDDLRKGMAEAVLNLLAALAPMRFYCKHLTALTWEAFLRSPAKVDQQCILRVKGEEIHLFKWHIEHTFIPLLAWSQPWSSLLGDLTNAPMVGPLIAAKPGSSKAIAPVQLQRILGRFGYPVTPVAAQSYAESVTLAAGREKDQETVAVIKRHDADLAAIHAMAEPGALEKLWAERFPESPREGALTTADVALLGANAARAWRAREEAQLMRVLGDEFNEHGKHMHEVDAVVALRAATNASAPAVQEPQVQTAPPTPEPQPQPKKVGSLFGGVTASPASFKSSPEE